MRYRGRITEWKDDKGFGFVTPDGGIPRVFVHIKSFSNRRRRPLGNEAVSYELKSDGLAQGFAGVFLLIVAAAVAAGKLPVLVLFVVLVASCVTFLAYVFDKAAAMRGRWRTHENTLHLLSLAGGWPGAMLAQRWARHKTQKRAFNRCIARRSH